MHHIGSLGVEQVCQGSIDGGDVETCSKLPGPPVAGIGQPYNPGVWLGQDIRDVRRRDLATTDDSYLHPHLLRCVPPKDRLVVAFHVSYTLMDSQRDW